MATSASIRARSGWTAAAKRVFRDVVDAHPELEKAKLSAVYTACDLLAEADRMQEQIDTDGLMIAGSMGQMVAHPLVAEVRQYRKAAADAIRTLNLEGRSSASAAGANLATKRWSGRPANVTPIKRPA